MGKGKLVVFEGIYGSGQARRRRGEPAPREARGARDRGLRDRQPGHGAGAGDGAQDLDTSWRYGVFEADLFFELAWRARVASVVRDELARGKTVLCKGFTLASAVHARLLGHDWVGEELNVLERRARGIPFGREVVPDLTLFVDVRPEVGGEAARRPPPGVLPGGHAGAAARPLPPGALPAAGRGRRGSSPRGRRTGSSRRPSRPSSPSVPRQGPGRARSHRPRPGVPGHPTLAAIGRIPRRR